MIKLGLQGLTKFFGPEGAFLPGQTTVIMAPGRSYKTSFLIKTALWAVKYNAILDNNSQKKRVILLFTNADSNIIAERITNEASKLLGQFQPYNVFSNSGYIFEIRNIRSGDDMVESYKDAVQSWLDRGDGVALTLIDDIDRIVDKYNRGLSIRPITDIICDFNRKNNIASLITLPATQRYYDGGATQDIIKKEIKALDGLRVVDTALLLLRETNNLGVEYLTAKLLQSKNFYPTNHQDAYFAYPIVDGQIEDDADKAPGYVTSIYAPDEQEQSPTYAIWWVRPGTGDFINNVLGGFGVVPTYIQQALMQCHDGWFHIPDGFKNTPYLPSSWGSTVLRAIKKRDYSGIVIRREDAHYIAGFPGFVTDFNPTLIHF